MTTDLATGHFLQEISNALPLRAFESNGLEVVSSNAHRPMIDDMSCSIKT